MPRTRKWPRALSRFSTLKPWNSCTLAPERKVGTQLAALNTARGRIARACFRPTLGTPGRLLPAAPSSNQAATSCPDACKACANGARIGSA